MNGITQFLQMIGINLPREAIDVIGICHLHRGKQSHEIERIVTFDTPPDRRIEKAAFLLLFLRDHPGEAIDHLSEGFGMDFDPLKDIVLKVFQKERIDRDELDRS